MPPASAPQTVRFQPMPTKATVRLWHRARDSTVAFTRPGQHGDAIGHTALAVLHALTFDFLNNRPTRSI